MMQWTGIVVADHGWNLGCIPASDSTGWFLNHFDSRSSCQKPDRSLDWKHFEGKLRIGIGITTKILSGQSFGLPRHFHRGFQPIRADTRHVGELALVVHGSLHNPEHTHQ